MTENSDPDRPKKSWLKLILFGALCLILALFVVGWMLFSSFSGLFYWGGELQKALDLSKKNSELSRTRVEQIFNEAEKAEVSAPTLMSMYRNYAMSLYMRGEIIMGDEQIDKAIALGKDAPPTDLGIADQLCHAYQDRGWVHHRFWLSDKKMDDGAKDQEMAVKVAERAFGVNHQQTNFKAPGLAVIYADIGKSAQADQLIERCVNIAETQATAKNTHCYVYGMLARIRAVEHRYKEALAAYFKSREVGSVQESNRAWDEFVVGLRFGQPKQNEVNQLAQKLLNKGEFAALDKLAEKFTKEKSEYWDGFWKLDYLTTPLEWGQNVDAIHYDQLKLDLTTWLKKNPNSTVARASLANLHINRAWEVRDEDDYGPKFRKLMAEARKTLDAAPNIKDSMPFAYVPLLRLTIPANDKATFLKLVDDGHKRWPTFFKLDNWAIKFMSVNWLGESGEQQEFINKRADTIGGAQGDKFYARVASYMFHHDEKERVIGKHAGFEWERIKRGFKQIFKEYPDQVEARIAYLRLAITGDHLDDAKNIDW